MKLWADYNVAVAQNMNLKSALVRTSLEGD